MVIRWWETPAKGLHYYTTTSPWQLTVHCTVCSVQHCDAGTGKNCITLVMLGYSYCFIRLSGELSLFADLFTVAGSGSDQYKKCLYESVKNHLIFIHICSICFCCFFVISKFLVGFGSDIHKKIYTKLSVKLYIWYSYSIL